jgi:hypothetical protein
MSRIGNHVRSNLVAYVAVFIALGGTASAGVIVSSNDDVAPGTISGHNPPPGDHANIISGSVDTGDLASGSVVAGKLADGSVTTPKFGPTAKAPAALNSDRLAGIGASRYVRAGGASEHGLIAEDNAATVEIGATERVAVITFPGGGAPFLHGIFRINCNDTTGTTLFYENNASSSQTLFVEGVGSNASRLQAPAGSEITIDDVLATGGGAARHHVELALVGAGLGDARYDFYLEHDDSSSPDFSDLCSGFGFVTTAWRS